VLKLAAQDGVDRLLFLHNLEVAPFAPQIFADARDFLVDRCPKESLKKGGRRLGVVGAANAQPSPRQVQLGLRNCAYATGGCSMMKVTASLVLSVMCT